MDNIALSPLSLSHGGGEEGSVVEDVHMTNAEDEVELGAAAAANDNTANNNMESPTTSVPLFARNDKVFARDGKSKFDKCYYPGTVKSRRLQPSSPSLSGWQFKVHYHGWNSRYDQWVAEAEILKDTEQNRKFLERSKLLQQKGKDENSSTVGSGIVAVAATSRDASASATAVATKQQAQGKRKRGSGDNPEDPRAGAAAGSAKSGGAKRRGPPTLVSLYEDYCELPLTLKTILLDESEKICRIGHDVPFTYDCPPVKLPPQLVHPLPATVTIQQVLRHFCKKKSAAVVEKQQQQQNEAAATDSTVVAEKKPEKKRLGPVSLEVEPTVKDVEDFCSGLSSLFQSALPKFLLYPQERPQFDVLAKDPKLSQKPLAEIYGCEYLLRLYVRLPVLMMQQQSNTEQIHHVKVVGPLLADLLVLLQKNKQACFKGGYQEFVTSD